MRRATWFILGLHGLLLLITLPDYRVSIDAGYHVSLARYYAEHGPAFWDHINFGPGGRPNLQGPLMHVGIAILGRILGGSGDAYVLANAILAIAQWAAAMFTAVYFARRFGGDLAALFAGSLLCGSAFAAASFYGGLPSGWIFILTPWAIHFFLEDKLLLSTLATSAAIYAHLGGYLTAPFGIFIAALLARRGRSLAIVGGATAILTAPYTIHFLRHLEWYRGQHGNVATWLAPLIYLLAAMELVRLLRRPREHAFLVAWFTAPAAWVVQDYTRFLLQSTLAGSVLGGLCLARLAGLFDSERKRAVFAAIFVALAILFPLGLPSLVVEGTWAFGLRYPRFLDWNEARALAQVIERAGLTDRLVSVYNPTQGVPIAVFAPVKFERGHWVEVQPRDDPARRLSAGVKVYVAPLPPNDPTLVYMEKRGLVKVHGGSALSSVVTLPAPLPVEWTAPIVAKIMSEEASWLAANAVNNELAPRREIFSRSAIEARRLRTAEQRSRAGRIEVAVLVYAYSLERAGDPHALGTRGAARGFGNLANFLGDEATINFMGDARHERLRQNLARWAAEVAKLAQTTLPSPELDQATRKLFDDYFGG